MSLKVTKSHFIARLIILPLIWLLVLTFTNSAEAANIENDFKELKQQSRTNQSDLDKQKVLVENNSVKLFETLIRLEELTEQSVKYSDILKTHGGQFETLDSRLGQEYKKQVLDTVNASGFWLFIATLLVFVMPIGFITFESGQIKAADNAAAVMKHVLTWVMVFLVYFVFGFGLMYGESWSGMMGTSLIFLASSDLISFFNLELEHIASAGGFLFFQLAFAMTTGLIVATALDNHLPSSAYGFIALCIAGLVYPVFGHWAWSSHLVANNLGWLESTGFKDFAGSTVVHSLAAWFALVWILGLKAVPESLQTSSSNASSSSPNLLIYSLIGVYVLWFGWVGMVSGSHLRYDSEVITLILNTSLAGVAAGLAVAFTSIFWGKMKVMGGALSGFVAISAACDLVVPLEAIIIGAIAGLFYQLSCSVLSNTVLKQHKGKAVGVIAAHGFCGIWGTLCVALFGGEGFLSAPDMVQFMIQLKGVAVAIGFSMVSAGLCLSIYRVFSKVFGKSKSAKQ